MTTLDIATKSLEDHLEEIRRLSNLIQAAENLNVQLNGTGAHEISTMEFQELITEHIREWQQQLRFEIHRNVMTV